MQSTRTKKMPSSAYQRWYTVPLAVMLLFGLGALPSAHAQNNVQENPAQGNPAQGNQGGPGARPGTPPAPGSLLTPLIEDDIDPKQPLKTGFVINVSVQSESGVNGNYQVGPSGHILLKLDENTTPLFVRGLTADATAAKIADFLKDYLVKPKVIVTIVSVPNSVVTVSGAVRLAGAVAIGRHTTLMELLTRTGWDLLADFSQVEIMRYDDSSDTSKSSLLTFHLNHYYQPRAGVAPDISQNPVLQNRDAIFVPLKSNLSNGVYSVSGEVLKPALSVPLRVDPPMTIREVVSLAGGTTAFANRKMVIISRAYSDKPIEIDLDKAEQGDPYQNVEVRAEDAVYIPRLDINEYIDVVGGFAKPGRQPYAKSITLTQAISDAGGVAPNAKLQDGVILRHPDNDPKHTQIIPYHWKNILKHKETDVSLLPGDTVWLAPGGTAPHSLQDILAPLTTIIGLSTLGMPLR